MTLKFNLNSKNRSQVFALGVLVLAWGLFTQSSIIASGIWWSQFLLYGRVTMSVLAGLALISLLLRPRANALAKYMFACIAFQAVCASLEPSRKFEFYEYVSYFLLINALAYDGTLRHWLRFHLPIVAIGMGAPLFFKEASTYTTLSAALYNLTTPIVICFLVPVILRLSTTRYAALEENIELSRRLLASESDAKDVAVADLTQARAQIARDAVMVSIGRMAGMLAHDVRKPFSLFAIGISALQRAKGMEEVTRLSQRLKVELERAVSSVDGLISDVMEVGSSSTHLIRESVSPEELIEATLAEAFRLYPESDVKISYRFSHTHKAYVHSQKVGRVLSNIVDNAIQSMNHNGEIWFTTMEQNGFIEFCVGNSGSLIPAENLPKLFDAFFTIGKKGGTGLGLAIAHKVVSAHGGRIWCESSRSEAHPEGKVEFFFTMPVADGIKSSFTATLASHIRKFQEMMALTHGNEPSVGRSEKSESALESDLIEAIAKLGRPLRVLIVDDEAVYKNALASYLSRISQFEPGTEVVQVDRFANALLASSDQDFDLVITDIELGPESPDGFEVVRELRAKGTRSLVCVHSNRIVAADYKLAIDSGADSFLPKPMARAQLLKLVLQAVWNRNRTKGAAVPKSDVGEVRLTLSAVTKLEVAVLDDNPFILDAWADALEPNAKAHLFSSLDELLEKLESEPRFLDRLVCVITDMHFDGASADGLDIGRLVKGLNSKLPVLLSSDGHFATDEFLNVIDKVIRKTPVGIDVLATYAAIKNR